MKSIHEGMSADIKDEQILDFLKKFWIPLTVCTTIVISGVIGWQWHAYLRRGTKEQNEAAYHSAQQLLNGNEAEAARRAFAVLAEKRTGGYSVVAGLQEATIMAEMNTSIGINAYKNLANSSHMKPKILADLARIRAGYLALDGNDPQLILSLVGNMIDETHPLRHSAREIMLIVAMKKKDWTTVINQAGVMLASPEIPTTLAKRVKKFANIATRMLPRNWKTNLSEPAAASKASALRGYSK